MYADFGLYVDGYLIGKTPIIPEDDFAFWEQEAEQIIDRCTFGRAKKQITIQTNESVQKCTCAIAELLYKADKLESAAFEDGVAGLLTSYSNDGQSATYTATESAYTESGKQRKIIQLLDRYLGDTGLLYRGG